MFAFSVFALAAVAAHGTNLIWIGGANNWNVAGNWSPAQVPTAADDVFITNNGTYTVTLSANSAVGSVTVGSASGTQTLDLGRFNLTINGPNTSVVSGNGHIDMLLNCAIAGPGNLTVNGTLNFANGALNTGGAITIGSGGVLAIGPNNVTLARTVNNGGAATWSGGGLTMAAGSVFNNLAGGMLDITADGRLGTTTASINNSGLVRQTAGTAGTTIGASFNNSGTVQVQTLALSLGNGGTHSGIFSNAPGATLALTGGSHALTASSFVTGSGTVALSGGATILTTSGLFDTGTTLAVTAGTVTLAAGCNVTGATLAIISGILNYNSAGSVAAINLGGGTLGGTSTINVTGPLTLAGGTVTSALVNANGGLNINGGGFILNGGKLINRGTAVWSAGNFTGANGAVFTNALGATFLNSFDGNAPSGAGATPLWVNNGIFQKTNGTVALGATSIDFQFLNTGTVEVQTNTLRYAVNTQTAGLTLLDGGSLTAQAQPLQLLGGSLVGTGLVTVANLQNVINSAEISPGFYLGELDIAGNYQQTASGVLNIELGGYLSGTGFDLVTVTGGGAGGVIATLAGTLNVTLTNGFSPTNGATFTFLTTSSRIGTFATFLYPSNDIGMTLSYGATFAKVTVSNLKPTVAIPISNPAPITYGSPFSLQFAANTFSDPDNNTLTYTASGMPAGITFTSASRTFSGTPTQGGVFLVAVTATDNDIPSLSVTNTFTLTVSPANVTGSFTAGDKTYDGNSNASVLTLTLTGVVAADLGNVTLTGGTAGFATATVGTGKTVTLTGATLTGTAAGNYNLSSVSTTTAAITALGFTGSFTAADKVYDGNTNATVLTRSLSGVLAGDTVNVTLTGGTAGFANATVGAGKLVTLTGATLTGTAADNYSLSSVGTTTAAVTALGITGNFTAADKIYDGNASATVLTRTLNGVLAADAANLNLTGGTASFANATVGAGRTVTLNGATITGTAVGNYSLSTVGTTTAAITAASLTVAALDASRVYGQTNPVFTAIYLGFVNGETNTVLGGTLVLSSIADTNSSAGQYPINLGGLTAANYSLTFSDGTLTVLPHALTVTVQPKTKIYGAADPVFTVSYAGFVNGESNTVLGGTLAFSRAAGENVAGSPYAVTPSGLTSTNYSVTYLNGTITINQAALTIAADNQTKVYGAADPTLTFTASRFQYTDTQASVLAGALTRAAGESVVGGPYAITQGTLAANGNYTISFSASALAITPAPLTIAAQAKSKVYGAADPALTFTASGFQFTDTLASVLTGALTRSVGESVAGSPYAITQGTLAANGNYTISFTASALTIAPAPLTIAAQAKTKVYGTTDPALTFTASGFQFADTQASVLTGALTRAAGETVAGSPYAITQGTLAASGNYTISFTASALTITPAALVATANNSSRLYGAANPGRTGTVSGLQNGDSITASFATVATASSPVGAYAITATLADPGSRLGNYALTSNNGTLTVTAAALTVLADNKTRSFGSANPVFIGTLSGLKNADNITATYSSVATSASPVGTYPIVPAVVDLDNRVNNYTVTLVNGTLTVTNATTQRTVLVVDANSSPGVLVNVPVVLAARGDENGVAFSLAFDPALLTYQSNTLGSDMASGSTLTVDTNSAPTGALGVQAALSPSGTFPAGNGQLAIFTFRVSPAIVGNTNVAVTFANSPTVQDVRTANAIALPATFTGGNVSVTPFSMTVTADHQSRTYGAANPVLSGTLIGVQPGDNITATFATVASAGNPVGTYAIIASLLDPDHKLTKYSVTTNNGTLTVTPASLTIAALPKSKVYGAADPALTFTASGFQSSDTAASVLTGALTRVAGETVTGSPYAITRGTLAADANYTLGFTGNSLAITLAPLAISADDLSKGVGAADPAFTANYAGFVNGETVAVLGGALILHRTPGEDVGDYLITASGLASSNYAITFAPGILTITASNTITAPAPILLALVVTSTEVVITWTSVSNVNYRVQYNPLLTTTNWIDLIGEVVASGRTASKTDSMTRTNRFYRVQVWP